MTRRPVARGGCFTWNLAATDQNKPQRVTGQSFPLDLKVTQKLQFGTFETICEAGYKLLLIFGCLI